MKDRTDGKFYVMQIYIPNGSANSKSNRFWQDFRAKYKGKASTIVRQIVEDHFEKLSDDDKYFEIAVEGELYGGMMKKIK